MNRTPSRPTPERRLGRLLWYARRRGSIACLEASFIDGKPAPKAPSMRATRLMEALAKRSKASLETLSVLGILCLLLSFHCPTAQAFTCSAASPGTQAFGNVSPVSGSSYTTSGTIAVTCTVAPVESLATGTQIRVCLSIGGASGSTPRTLPSGANSLQYNLYTDAAHTTVFGSALSSPPSPVAVDFNVTLLGILLGGSATINVPVYGLLPAGQITAPAGSYSQSFNGTNAGVNYVGYVGAAPACSGSWTSGGSFAFSATATVINDCNISANNINFGSSGVLSSALYATGAITAQCTLNDSYSVALNAGSTSGASLADRQLAVSGGGAVAHYQLYTSSGYSTIWGDGSTGTSTVGGSGSGSNQTYVVYGKVPVQSTPVPGSYSDTVTATIIY